MSRPAPDRRYPGHSLFFAGLLALVGGLALAGPRSDSEAPTTPPDSAAFWLFFSDEAWVRAGTLDLQAALTGRVREKSGWLKALSVDVPLERVPDLAGIPGVIAVRPVGRLPKAGGWSGGTERILREGSNPLQAPGADTVYGELETVLRVLDIPPSHELGFRGTGTRIGILDGLFLGTHLSLRMRPAIATRDFVDQDGSVEPGLQDLPEEAAHGTALWSLISGDWPGVFTGAAPGAGILLARIQSDDDPEGADEDRWVAGLEWLETQGARLVVSGVGFRNFEEGGYGPDDLNGDVAPATMAADEAARRGVLVVAPVGNGGPESRTLQSPADGDSVMAVGAVDALGMRSVFSARGPTVDGREKPDLMAPGDGVPVASPAGEGALEQAQGTEISAALLAGAGALFIEAYPERGPMGVLEALKNSAPSSDGPFFHVPRVAAAIIFPDGVWPLPAEDVNSEGRVTNLAPRFQWNVPTTHPLGLPVTFHLELSEDSLFQGVLLNDSVVGTFARRLQTPLPPRTRLFWRVRARSPQGIEWATAPQGPLEVPPWVSLEVMNDPGGTQVAEAQPEFRWSALGLSGPAGPLSFELQVFSDREGEVIQRYPGLEEDHFRIPEPLPFNVPLRWQVIAEARTGTADTVSSAGPFVVTGGANPPVTILYQNFPNPFPDPQKGVWDTRIWFDLAEHSRVNLAVYDMRGRLVRSLIPGKGCGPVELPPGLYGREAEPAPDPCAAFLWDGRDSQGGAVSPGVYLLRLRAAGVVEVRRVVYWP